MGIFILYYDRVYCEWSSGHDFGRFDLVLESVSASLFVGRQF